MPVLAASANLGGPFTGPPSPAALLRLDGKSVQKGPLQPQACHAFQLGSMVYSSIWMRTQTVYLLVDPTTS